MHITRGFSTPIATNSHLQIRKYGFHCCLHHPGLHHSNPRPSYHYTKLDIACQWFVNLFVWMAEHWPPHLRIPASTKLIPTIPKLHELMHGQKNHQVYLLNFIPGVGKADMEMPEHIWAGHNGLGNSTKTQGPGGCHDVLDDHFSFWNWLKYVGLGKTLMSRYEVALAERN